MKSRTPEELAFKSGYHSGFKASLAVRRRLLQTLVRAALPLEALHLSVTWELAPEIKEEIEKAVLEIRDVVDKFQKGSNAK